ncbi:MAG: hypothetical protein HFE90_10745 [Firmicutes bacterium]|nr:hypothetical protein [Bacillota bacterium]
MRINLLNSQSIFRPQMQNPMQSTIGQLQNSGLQKVFQQANANYVDKRNHDTVDLSKKALEILEASKTEETEPDQKAILNTQAEPDQIAIFGYQKYPPGISKEEWAENSILEQRNGIKTYSDLVDYAKSKLQFTMSKIEELENYLNGTGTHSDPNMTKDLAETYLHNYKQSIQSDYTDILSMQYGGHRFLADEFDELSGGQASQATENLLNSISAESLGLSNLSDDPQEIMKALENASKILDGMNQKVEEAYSQLTGGKQFTEPARSSALFRGDTPMDYFENEMEQPYRIINTNRMKFTGQTLDLLDNEQMKFID